MSPNPFYGFLLNMWIMRQLDADYLMMCVSAGYISESEKTSIMITPQIPEGYDPNAMVLAVQSAEQF